MVINYKVVIQASVALMFALFLYSTSFGGLTIQVSEETVQSIENQKHNAEVKDEILKELVEVQKEVQDTKDEIKNLAKTKEQMKETVEVIEDEIKNLAETKEEIEESVDEIESEIKTLAETKEQLQKSDDSVVVEKKIIEENDFSGQEYDGKRRTRVTTKDGLFYINGKLTYHDAALENMRGALISNRMVNTIFDFDEPEDPEEAAAYHKYFGYPDTGKWDAERNTREFIGNMSSYAEHGLNGITLGLQGGGPFFYQVVTPSGLAKYCTPENPAPWNNSAFWLETGVLREEYMNRMERVLNEADRLGMIVILQVFYQSQMWKMPNDIIKVALKNSMDWVMEKGYTNVIIEVANEYNHQNFKDRPGRVNKKFGKFWHGVVPDDFGKGIAGVVNYTRAITNKKFPVGVSLTSRLLPDEDIAAVSDVIFFHAVRARKDDFEELIKTLYNTYVGRKPIIINEDNSFGGKWGNRLLMSAKYGIGWGPIFDCKARNVNDYKTGFQCLPINYSIKSTGRKRNYFNGVKNLVSPVLEEALSDIEKVEEEEPNDPDEENVGQFF